jgi:selenocysteine-specific elongation factor
LSDDVDSVHVDEWRIDPHRWLEWQHALNALIDETAPADGLPVDAVRDQLHIPDSRLVVRLVATQPGMQLANGWVHRRDADIDLSPIVHLLDRLREDPLAAPDGDEVRSLDRGVLARGVRAGRLLHIAPGIYVAADAPDRALTRLAELPQPFTVSAATKALGSSRRVVVPLLEHLDAIRRSRRLPDGTRVLVGAAG